MFSHFPHNNMINHLIILISWSHLGDLGTSGGLGHDDVIDSKNLDDSLRSEFDGAFLRQQRVHHTELETVVNFALLYSVEETFD